MKIIRILNGAFKGITGNRLDFYPDALRGEINAAKFQRLRHDEVERRLADSVTGRSGRNIETYHVQI